MPTVILLDVSLSMMQPVGSAENPEEHTRKSLASLGISTFLDYLSAHNKLEFVSLVIFSSLWEQVVTFTREYETIKNAVNDAEEYNKTCLEPALAAVSSIVTQEWGIGSSCQVIVVTDGSVGIGEGSIKHSLESFRRPDLPHDKFPLPYSFPSKLHVVCIAPPTDASLKTSQPLYEQLVGVAGSGSKLWLPDSALTPTSVNQLFTKLAETEFTPFTGTLTCGGMKCGVHIFPAPDVYDRDHDFEHIRKEVEMEIKISGFFTIADVSNPPHISRHLVLPMATPTASSDQDKVKESESPKAEAVKTEDGEESEEGKTAAFTVLLHGALKISSMVALVELSKDWYGMLFSWADNKKKSNLMLSIFQPGSDVIPWLGDFQDLTNTLDFPQSPFGEDHNSTPFPVKPPDRRSYTQNCVVWVKPQGLQADIQKVLRNARKLPEKQVQFYKELNRVRRSALSYGFHDLLIAVAQLLERECTMLPGNAHPDAALQLTHAANALHAETATDIAQNILPLRTNFSAESQGQR